MQAIRASWGGEGRGTAVSDLFAFARPLAGEA